MRSLRDSVAQAAPGGPRSALEAALAEQLIDAGEYAEALVHLASARRHADHQNLREHVDLLMGVALLRRGEYERAEPHLERSLEAARARGEAKGEARAMAYLGDVYRRRGDERAASALDQARVQLEVHPDGDLLAQTLVGLAAVALRGKQIDEAERLCKRALELSMMPEAVIARSSALLTLAEVLSARGDWVGADMSCQQAIVVVAAAELNRELAEAFYAHAHIRGAAAEANAEVPRGEKPATLLARAQELFRDHGALSDLERVREAFRRFGRRATDQVAVNEVRTMIDELRASRLTVAREVHRLSDTLEVQLGRLEADAPPGYKARFHALNAGAQESERAVAAAVESMSAAEGRVFTATQAIISERENIRTLLDLCRTLNEQRTLEQLVEESCRMAAQLTGADRALVALIDDGRVGVRAAFHMPELSSERGWRLAVDRVIAGAGPILVEAEGAAKRDDEARLGAALCTPLRQGPRLYGAVYVDKELCGGLFTAQDLDLLAIFCAQAATMLENVRVDEELRLAARSRAAVLETISDGVLSLDRRGEVTSINAVAARILGVSASAPLKLQSLPDLAFLRATLDRGEELEARVTRIGSGEYMVNARVIRSDHHEVHGVVATFTEMKRVTSMAQRIAGSHARYNFGDLIGQAPILRRKLQLAEAAARSDSTVLITGESGTGKEVLAQAIHNASARASGPFVGINCSAIPRELLESELFGYEGGAFTGARKGGQPGKFELAEGGTILLDEIGDMPVEMQAKLLRVLQEKRVRRIGGNRELALDARVIATTNVDLEERVQRGQFRSDLLFRLKVIHIELPPLRERPSDIPVLVDHFLALFAARLGKKVRTLSPEVMGAFQRYAWPGNIRELENVLEGEINLMPPDVEELDQVPDGLVIKIPTQPRMATITAADLEPQTMEEAEKQMLMQALARHGGSIPEVARSLGISRGTVYNKMRRFALDANSFRVKS